jgi:hypothetical protein
MADGGEDHHRGRVLALGHVEGCYHTQGSRAVATNAKLN